MKWPASLTLIRHAQSTYNELRLKKEQDPEYQRFKKMFDQHPDSSETRCLAEAMFAKYALNVSDYMTPLSRAGEQQAQVTGRAMWDEVPEPDVIHVSPYLRTRSTLHLMCMVARRQFNKASIILDDERMREQDHGLALLYSDWRIFEVFHPEQRLLRKLQGPYWYQFPQGESVPQVRDRIRSMTTTTIREYAGLNVMWITHHLSILSARANFERLSPEEFIRLDEEEKPVNCGVTIYRGDPRSGRNGKLELQCYNKSFCH